MSSQRRKLFSPVKIQRKSAVRKNPAKQSFSIPKRASLKGKKCFSKRKTLHNTWKTISEASNCNPEVFRQEKSLCEGAMHCPSLMDVSYLETPMFEFPKNSSLKDGGKDIDKLSFLFNLSLIKNVKKSESSSNHVEMPTPKSGKAKPPMTPDGVNERKRLVKNSCKQNLIRNLLPELEKVGETPFTIDPISPVHENNLSFSPTVTSTPKPRKINPTERISSKFPLGNVERKSSRIKNPVSKSQMAREKASEPKCSSQMEENPQATKNVLSAKHSPFETLFKIPSPQKDISSIVSRRSFCHESISIQDKLPDDNVPSEKVPLCIIGTITEVKLKPVPMDIVWIEPPASSTVDFILTGFAKFPEKKPCRAMT